MDPNFLMKKWTFSKNRELVYDEQIFKNFCERVILAENLESVKLNNLPNDFVKEWKIQILKFNFYSQYCEKHKIDILIPLKELIINHLLDPEYAKKIDKKIDLSVKKAISVDFIVNDNEDLFEMKHIMSVFPPSHLMFYKKTEPLEDYLLTLNDKGNISEQAMNEFEEECDLYIKKDYVPRKFDLFDEISMRQKNVVMNEDLTTESSHKCKELLKVEKDELSFLIKKIQKNVIESREIAIPTMRTKRACHQFRVLSKGVLKHPFDMYTSAITRGVARKLDQDGNYFLLFDMKKFGWMFPKQLVKSVMKQIVKYYPDESDFFKAFSETNLIESKDNKIKLMNGWVLGQFDNIGSFILSTLFSKFLKGNLEYQELTMCSLFKGDDSFIKIKKCHRKVAVKFWTEWLNFLSKDYKITLKREKCILSKSGIFCEVYGKNENINLSKDCNYLLTFFDSLRCENITHCKEFVNIYHRALLSKGMECYISMLDVDDSLEQAVHEVMSCTGFEFSEKEFKLPFEAGGWLTFCEEGMNTFFIIVEEGKIPPEYMNVINIKKDDVKVPVKYKKKNGIFKFFKKDSLSQENNYFQDLICRGIIKKFEERSFSKINKNYEKTWEDYSKRRAEAFKFDAHHKMIDFCISNYIKERMVRNYLIPRSYFKITDKLFSVTEMKVDKEIESAQYKNFYLSPDRAWYYDEGYTGYEDLPKAIPEKFKFNFKNEFGSRVLDLEVFKLMMTKNFSYKEAKKNMSMVNSIYVSQFIMSKEDEETFERVKEVINIDPDDDIVYFCPLMLRWVGGKSAYKMMSRKRWEYTNWLDFSKCSREKFRATIDAMDLIHDATNKIIEYNYSPQNEEQQGYIPNIEPDIDLEKKKQDYKKGEMRGHPCSKRGNEKFNSKFANYIFAKYNKKLTDVYGDYRPGYINTRDITEKNYPDAIDFFMRNHTEEECLKFENTGFRFRKYKGKEAFRIDYRDNFFAIWSNTFEECKRKDYFNYYRNKYPEEEDFQTQAAVVELITLDSNNIIVENSYEIYNEAPWTDDESDQAILEEKNVFEREDDLDVEYNNDEGDSSSDSEKSEEDMYDFYANLVEEDNIFAG